VLIALVLVAVHSDSLFDNEVSEAKGYDGNCRDQTEFIESIEKEIRAASLSGQTSTVPLLTEIRRRVIIWFRERVRRPISRPASSSIRPTNVPVSSSSTSSTSSTTTSATTIPSVGICSHPLDLFDGNGNYLKSVCQTKNRFNYAKAEAACIANGMNLFIIDSEEAQNALFNYANSVPNSSPMWINGRWKGESNWFVFNPLKALLFEGVLWFDDLFASTCLRMLNSNGLSKVQGYNCKVPQRAFCEYSDLFHIEELKTIASESRLSGR